MNYLKGLKAWFCPCGQDGMESMDSKDNLNFWSNHKKEFNTKSFELTHYVPLVLIALDLTLNLTKNFYYIQ